VEARNTVGYSVPSDVVTILAAVKPTKPGNPVTTNVGDQVHIDWEAPSPDAFAAFGAIIRSYEIWLQKADLAFVSNLVDCDGENDHFVIETRHCEIPITVLQSAPFNLPIGSQVKAKIVAVNAVGKSEYS
jgi:hypothetical protein